MLKSWLIAKVVSVYGGRVQITLVKLIREALSGYGYAAMGWVATMAGVRGDYHAQIDTITSAVAAIVVSFVWSLAEKWLGITQIRTAADTVPPSVANAVSAVTDRDVESMHSVADLQALLNAKGVAL